MKRRVQRGAALAVASMGFLAGAAAGAQPDLLNVSPGGYAIVSGTGADAIMAAYQKPYAMNFEIWKPVGLPAGWYATFDGFPVAQVVENRWVYGQLGADGAIIPTDILVGSVVPMEVPALARVAAEWGYSVFLNSPEFRRVTRFGCTHMGYLTDPLVRTVVAWKAGKPGLWVWLGTRWKRFENDRGEYTWQMLKRYRPWISRQLRENDFWGIRVMGLSDLARQWGLIWEGSLSIDDLGAYRDGGGNGNGQSIQSATQAETDNSGGNWDVK